MQCKRCWYCFENIKHGQPRRIREHAGRFYHWWCKREYQKALKPRHYHTEIGHARSVLVPPEMAEAE